MHLTAIEVQTRATDASPSRVLQTWVLEDPPLDLHEQMNRVIALNPSVLPDCEAGRIVFQWNSKEDFFHWVSTLADGELSGRNWIGPMRLAGAEG